MEEVIQYIDGYENRFTHYVQTQAQRRSSARYLVMIAASVRMPSHKLPKRRFSLSVC